MIQKSMRKELRRWHSGQAKEILEEFKDLGRLDGVFKVPFTHNMVDE